MMTAYLTANPEQKLEAAAQQYVQWGWPERSDGHMQKGDGNATYRNRIIDAITIWIHWIKVQNMRSDKELKKIEGDKHMCKKMKKERFTSYMR